MSNALGHGEGHRPGGVQAMLSRQQLWDHPPPPRTGGYCRYDPPPGQRYSKRLKKGLRFWSMGHHGEEYRRKTEELAIEQAGNSSIRLLETPQKRVKDSTVDTLSRILKMAESGEVTEVTIHYRTADGNHFIAESFTLNRHEASGWLLDMAIERLR